MAGNFKQNNNNNRKFNKRRGPRPERKPIEEPPIEDTWEPKTQLGKDVLAGKYTTINQVLESGRKVMEPEIAQFLVRDLELDFINVGQAKGKFGGGKRKPSKSTQKVTMEGSQMSFSMICVSGNRNGVVGLGFGKARETVPSREKSMRKARQDLILIRRGSGDWESSTAASNSIPFAVEGKSGSVKIRFIPAPPGTGLVVESEVKKMLELAGIKDIWSRTYGSTKNKTNLMKAAFNALKNLQKVRLNPKMMEGRMIKEGDKDEQ